jgi:hypothetical protein
MYLVKALVATRFPTTTDYNGEVDWSANQYRVVDDSVIERIRQHTDVFSEIAGPDELDVLTAMLTAGVPHELAVSYSGTDASFQPIAVDLTVGDEAGSDTGTNPKFLAPFMGNLLGTAIAGVGNYLAGLFSAWSVGAHTSDYPTGAHVAILMDGGKGADAIYTAVIDGSDPSSETTAGAAFGVRQCNNNASSGVDYGLDLKDDGSRTSAYYSNPGAGLPFNVKKAQIRGSEGDWCVITAEGVPVDYTDGDPVASGEGFAGVGSLYVDLTNANVYVNAGTKAQPTWKQVTRAA